MHLSEISVKKPVAIGMFFIGMILLGLVSLSRLSVDLLPDLAYPKLTIWTTYRDVGPQEMEEFITRPVEEVLTTVPGVRRIQSVSREGISLVTMEFLWGTNMDFAMLNVREKLDQLRWTLPEEAGRPTIIQLDPRSQPIMAISVSGGDLIKTKELARNVFKRRLEQLKGVALAEVTGGLEREIQIDVDTRKLTVLGLTLEQVNLALDAANYNLPGGTIKKGLYRYSLRTLGEFQSPAEIENVVIVHTETGHPILIRNVATVTDGFAERESITRFNGQESIGILIQKESGSNTVEVTRLVKATLEQMQKDYPAIQLTVAAEQAQFIAAAISNLIQNILLGGLLAFLVLFFFLHDFRQPTFIALSIPISVITTFTILYLMDISLNIMSLGGLALAVGMLVDNSIVVLENIYRYRENGVALEPAAIQGAHEVGMPISAGTVTTIAVFLPVIYIYGAAGQLFREQALTVTFSLLASLVVAVTLLPALVAHFSGSAPKEPAASASTSMRDKDPAWHEQGIWKYLTFPFKILIKLVKIIFIEPFVFLFHTIQQFYKFIQKSVVKLSEPLFQHFEKYYQYIFDRYERMLERSLHHRGQLLFIVGLAAGFCILYSYFFLTRELMPRVDSGEFTITIQMPPGYSLEATSQTVSQIEQQLLKISDVEAVFATIGMTSEQFSSGSAEAAFNRGKMQVRLKNNRRLSTAEVIQRIRQQSGQLTDASVTFESSANVLQQILGTTSPPLALKIRGENLEVSLQLAQQLVQQIEDIAGLKDLHLNLELGRPEISLQLDREAMGRLGLTAAQVSNFIQSYMKGNIATYFKDFDKKIEVWVRPTVENRDEIEDLLNTFILFDEKHIPLRALLRVNERLGPTEILREEQSRQVVVYGQVQGRGFNAVINEIQARLAEITLPETHRIEIGGEQEELQQSFRSLLLALVLSVALIYMILAAQFESLMHPFVILLDIPISMALTFGLLTLLGLSLNVISFIGLIVLAGVAVNDSIVKVDFINQLRREGVPMMEAILQAGQKRFRPIVMTSATTVLGLIPMALGFGEGAELQRPLAVTILGGITISTFVSLVLVPVLYSVLEKNVE